VALPAFAAAHHAAARLLLITDPPATQQLIDISWVPGPQQQPTAVAYSGQMVQTDRRMPDSCIDHDPLTMWAVPIRSVSWLQQL